MYKESDHIHIIAMSTALGTGVSVRYMDRGAGTDVTAHNFPEGSTPAVHLLYRPGHYDILYPWCPSVLNLNDICRLDIFPASYSTCSFIPYSHT